MHVETAAKGVTGILIEIGGRVWFRSYNADYTFDDYLLTHPDLEVTITDPDAALITLKDGRKYLDISERSLRTVIERT